MEEQKNFRGKLGGALIYPIAILVVMIIVVVVMMVAVVPKLLEVFEEFDAEMPMATQILIGASDAFVNYWWAIALVVGILGISFGVWYQGYDAKKLVDSFLFKLPIVGNLRKKTMLTSYTQTLGMLIQSGVPIIDSLKLSAEMINSPNYREHLSDICVKVEKGVSIGTAMEAYDDFPTIMSQMMKVGEETGKLDQILFKLSRYFATEAERALAGLLAAFEPIIMVIMGLGVGFLVVAIILPIYDLTNQVSA
jgi:type IV pilus assembly protein PilC